MKKEHSPVVVGLTQPSIMEPTSLVLKANLLMSSRVTLNFEVLAHFSPAFSTLSGIQFL